MRNRLILNYLSVKAGQSWPAGAFQTSSQGQKDEECGTAPRVQLFTSFLNPEKPHLFSAWPGPVVQPPVSRSLCACQEPLLLAGSPRAHFLEERITLLQCQEALNRSNNKRITFLKCDPSKAGLRQIPSHLIRQFYSVFSLRCLKSDTIY